MTGTVSQSPVEPDAVTIAHVQTQRTALREAGMLSPEGCRLLARAEAVEAANREMAEVRRRMEKKLREMKAEAKRARRRME